MKPTIRPSRPPPTPGPIARAVARAAKQAGLSITELSGIADVSRPTLSLWLNGRRNMTVAQLERVLTAIARSRLAEVCRTIDGSPKR